MCFTVFIVLLYCHVEVTVLSSGALISKVHCISGQTTKKGNKSNSQGMEHINKSDLLKSMDPDKYQTAQRQNNLLPTNIL